MKFKALFYQNTAGFSASIFSFVAAACALFFDREACIALFVLFAVTIVINIIYSSLSFKSAKKYVSALSNSLFKIGNDNINEFPLPAVMCDKHGNIVWFNSQFNKEVVGDHDIKKISINDFLDDFTYDKYKESRVVNASFGESEYTAFVVNVNSKSTPMLCFYLFDDTALKEIALEYTYSRPFVMYLSVDNIEQLSRQLTDSKLAAAASGIERIIEEWLSKEDVVLKKTTNGNFVVIGEKRNLDILCENKFSVLKKVRDFNIDGVDIKASLSIGVGSGENLTVCDSRAKKSLDMAFGRGGDQAAIYSENGYIYYGGVSNRLNDNSRVSPRQTAANISNLIKKSNLVLIQGHKYSDFDAIGSALGMYFFAKGCGVDAYVVLDNKTTLSSSLVNILVNRGFKNFITPSKAADICNDDTVVIVCDTQRKILLDSSDLYDLAGSTVIIDHHRRTDDYISDADILYCVPSSSSTCELVAELIQYSTIQDNLSHEISTALLSGIVLDTKDFVLRTSQRTFEAAGFLRDHGADTVEVKKMFSIDADMALIKNDIIANAKIFNGFMIGICLSDNKNIRVITSSAADDMLNIDGVKASFVISKLGMGKYQISARSLGEENVQLIMEKLNGGGHITMAASQVKASDFDEARSMVLDAINDYLNSK